MLDLVAEVYAKQLAAERTDAYRKLVDRGLDVLRRHDDLDKSTLSKLSGRRRTTIPQDTTEPRTRHPQGVELPRARSPSRSQSINSLHLDAPWSFSRGRVLIFGDSWANHPLTLALGQTWPQLLGQNISADVRNFAMAGARSYRLDEQFARCFNSSRRRLAGNQTWTETLVVIHVGGNDFLDLKTIMTSKIESVFMGRDRLENLKFLQPTMGEELLENLESFLERMYNIGARKFLVSGVPIFAPMPIFNLQEPPKNSSWSNWTNWAMLERLVTSGKLKNIGINPGDAPSRVLDVQARLLNKRFTELLDNLTERYTDFNFRFFDEAQTLKDLRSYYGEDKFDQEMWDITRFHPRFQCHKRLAEEALRVLEDLHHLPIELSR